MKQTNNAIKFLMAQYRAIFQNAYFKGLATAAVVTAGLAAGQAQAAHSVYGDTQTSTEATVTIDGTSDKLENNLAAYGKLQVTDKHLPAPKQNIVITSGTTANDNFVKADGGAAKLTVKNLEIKAGAAANGLKVHSAGAHRSDLNVLDTVTITSGTLELGGKATDADQRAYLSAQKIVLNGANATDTVLKIGDFSEVGKTASVNGSKITAATQIDLNKNGKISFNGTAVGDSVLKGQFVGSGEATLDFTKKGTVSAFGTINKAQVDVTAAMTALIKLGSDLAQTSADESSLTINQGLINLKGADSVLKVSTGTLKLGDDVVLTNTTVATAAGLVVGEADSGATLVIKKDTFDNFLSGKAKLPTGVTGTAASGAAEIAAKGKLFFSDENVDLSGFKAADTVAAGDVKINDGAVIGGNNITIYSALTGKSAGSTTIKALDTLTLGDGTTESAKYGAKSFEAKNLELKKGFDDTESFDLQDKVTLSSTQADGYTQDFKAKIKAGEGLIKGDALKLNLTNAADALTIAAGNYETVGQDIDLTKGTLTVSSDVETYKSSPDKVESSLAIKGGKLTIAAENGFISVSGKKASLDLSNAASIELTGTLSADGTPVTVSDGTLVLNGTQVLKLVKKVSDGNSGEKAASIALTKHGVLKITDSLEIPGTMLSGGDISQNKPATPVINFDAKGQQSGGTLEVAETLTITGTNAAVNIGADGKIKAKSLVLNVTTPDTQSATLTSGNYVVKESLATENGKDIVTDHAKAKLTFGYLEPITGKTNQFTEQTQSGSIASTLTSTAGTHVVAAGNWTAEKDVTVTAGTFNIGNVDNKDADGNIIKTSLTVVGKLDATEGVTVAKESTLNANELRAGASAITVSGSANIAGKDGKATDPTGAYGVSLEGAGALTVNEGGVLNFTGKALEGFSFDETSNALLNDKVTTGSIITAAGSQVNLKYTSGTTITVDQLTNLNQVFDNGTINGIVNLGEATLDGLKPDGNKEITWTDAQKYENYLPGYTNNGLKEATLTGVATGNKVSGHFGSIKTDASFASGSSVEVQKKGGLYNAKPLAGDDSGKKYFAVNSSGDSLGLNIADKTTEFTLGGEGIIDHVKFAGSGTLAIDKGFGDAAGNVTVSKTISGGATSVLNIKNGQLTVAGEKKNGVEIGVLKSEAGTSLKTNVLKITGAAGSQSKVMGNVTVAADSGASTSIGAGGAIFGGKENKFAGSFAAAGDVEFTNGGTSTIDLTKDVADFAGDLGISGDAKVVVNGVLSMTTTPGATLSSQAFINVGEYDPANADKVNSSGFLQAQYISLGGNALAIDPAYGKNTSIVEVGAFTDTPDSPKTGVSTVKGDIYVLQNSALLVGMNAKGKLDVDSGRAFLASVQENGSLTDPEKGGKIGSLLYVNSQQKLADGSSIVVDALANEGNVVDANDVLKTKYTDAKNFGNTTDTADLYLGKGSVIALGAGAHKDNGSIVFDFQDAAVFAEQGGKIILDSDSYLKGDRNVVVFQDADNDGVNILGTAGTNDIRVETINGLMYFTLTAGQQSAGGTLTLDTDKVDSAFTAASAPMRDFLLGYTTLTKNWEEMYPRDGAPVAPGVKEEVLLGVAGPAQKNFVIDPNGKITGFDNNNVSPDLKNEDFHNYVAVATGTDQNGKPTYDIYKKAYNDFLEKIVQNTQGAAADQAARMGDFGGAAETALVATSTNYDAVAGRFGMGQQAGTMTIANNGQGSGLWVTPVYKSHESDGFDADGLGYGSDITLYGVALGGDVTLANGVRVGAMFNVGSGDADGQGTASVVSNDFD